MVHRSGALHYITVGVVHSVDIKLDDLTANTD